MDHVQPNQLRILVADDEEVTVMLYREILSSKRKVAKVFPELRDLADKLFGEHLRRASALSFELVTCRQGDQAVDAVKNSLIENRPFAVAFLDVRMPPGPDGIWAAEQIRALDPHIEIVIVTGHSDIHPGDIVHRIFPTHKLLYIQKPLYYKEISQLASALASKWLTEWEFRRVHEELEGWLNERTVELMQVNEQLEKEIAERKQVEEYLRQLEQAVETMQLGVIIIDLDGKIIYTNRAEAEMHGYQLEELPGQHVKILTPPELRKPLTLEQMKTWKGLMRESVNMRKDGTTFPVWLMSEIVKSAEGAPCAIVTSCEDITRRKQVEEALRAYSDHLEALVEARTIELTCTNEQLRQEIDERKRTAEALRKSEEKYRIVLEADPDPVVVYDKEERITYLNPAFTRVFGWTLEESFGRTIDFVPVENLPEARVIFEKIKHGEIVSGIETCRLARNRNRVDVSISGAGFFDSYGTLQGSVITIQNITERKKIREEINFIAYYDVLTRLPNRKSFYMRMEDELVRSQSRAGEKRRITRDKWTLLFLDLDRFKDINTLGHDIGDELLQAVAIRLQNCLRKSDYIFRLGGDEFTIILDGLINDTDVAKVAQKIQEEVTRSYHIKGHELYITVSIGISVYPDDGDDVETLVKNADMAMYAAKEEGLAYRFFTREMNRKALERMRLENSLRTALQYNQFVVYYQPMVDNSDRIIGTEALLRWSHPELKMISPSKFIPLAEETGAIVPIGKWVLYTACQQAVRWHKMGHTDFYVAVNLSPRQFREPDLVETVEQVFEATGLPTDCLKLEVTESGIMENPEQAIAKMKTLRSKGIRFSLDDFGTGYSSLSYLKRFPIDTLKIDRSFVTDCITNKDDQEIIRTIISMAHNLSMDTVAEGVETKEQRDFLVLHDCRIMQGYYFGRPMPSARFEEKLQMR